MERYDSNDVKAAKVRLPIANAGCVAGVDADVDVAAKSVAVRGRAPPATLTRTHREWLSGVVV